MVNKTEEEAPAVIFSLVVYSSDQTTYCGSVPMTPPSSCTASSGRWCRSFWARLSFSWRSAPALWPFEQRLSRRGNAPTRFVRISLFHRSAWTPKPTTTSWRRTLTPSPSCRRRHGPCRCLRCRYDAAIENIKRKRCHSGDEFEAGGRSQITEGATDRFLLSWGGWMTRNGRRSNLLM